MEAYLADAPPELDRASLLKELLAIEIEVRLERGEAPSYAEYIRRLPDARQLIDEVFPREHLLDTKPPSESVRDASETTWPEEVSIPEKFGRYRIERLLGKGAMGAVYLARDEQLQRNVALKIPKFSDRDEQLQRFYREARAAATLQHPNLCPVYDVGDVNGVHYISMAYIEGRPLSDYVDQAKPIQQRQVALLVRKLALALEEAHGQGVVHRDLKPGNVIINKRGEPVVMDFGLAHIDASDSQRLTREGALIGTPSYMAPEQVDAELGPVGPSSDIYSLGVIFYQLLTGKLPFHGQLMVVLFQIVSMEPAVPSQIRRDIDRDLEAICLRMLAKRAEDRYPCMHAVAEALTQFLNAQSRRAGRGASVALQLSVIKGPDLGRVFPIIEDEILDIGRAKHIPTQLYDTCISRLHCRLFIQNGRLTIADWGSTGGTYVNGERIVSRVLEPGDIILVGGTELLVEQATA
jgi:serine/threonine protein kinase